MYQVDERDRVIRVSDLPQPDGGAPTPIILADEHRCIVSYLTQDEAVSVVELSGVWALMFGAPNDEAFSGHPLAGRGLCSYSVVRIEQSSWIRSLERMNAVHPRHEPARFAALTHYVFAFHDSTLEVVARGVRVVAKLRDGEEVIPRMRDLLSAPA